MAFRVTRRLVLATSVVALLGSAAIAWFLYRVADNSFQSGADVVRLRHLQHYGKLLEEYKLKTGSYPFQGDSQLPIYVLIANNQQQKFATSSPPFPHKTVSVGEFISELEDGLGHFVDERYDPQLRPAGRPNFYIYMASGDDYFFAVHLHQPFSFTKRIGNNYHKVEISNSPRGQNAIWPPNTLFTSGEFQNAISRPIANEGFFADRDKQYEHDSKN